jgi:hypothetical protein
MHYWPICSSVLVNTGIVLWICFWQSCDDDPTSCNKCRSGHSCWSSYLDCRNWESVPVVCLSCLNIASDCCWTYWSCSSGCCSSEMLLYCSLVPAIALQNPWDSSFDVYPHLRTSELVGIIVGKIVWILLVNNMGTLARILRRLSPM